MRGFDLDGGTFFMCTEISPRCFTIQQVSDVDVALKEVTTKRPSQKQCSASSSAALPPPPAEPSVRRPSSSAADVTDHPSCASHSPFLPMLPWWFTAECRQKLMGVPPPTDDRAVTPDTRPPSSIGPLPISQEQLRQRIQRQLEYYFSRENLINDRYLRCQMDADQYVPIKIVANFPKVTQLTTDLDLIVDVLKASSQVQVDESGQKVRPMSRRCTIILREIPEDADENEVKSMFGDDCPPYQTLSYGLNNSWYVTFATEQDTQKAFFHLQTFGKTFNGSPVFARIKTGGAPIGADMHGGGIQQSTHGGTHIQLNGGALRGQLIIHHGHIMTDQPEQNRTTPSPNGDDNVGGIAKHGFNLGKTLTQCGFSPRATFRPMAPSPTPLQSTASAVPEPTSFFTQPILHNGDFTSIHHRFDLRRVNEHRYVHLSLRGNTPPSADDDEDADQAVLFDENHCCDHHHYDREECCDEEFGVHFDDIASDSVGGGPLVLWQGNGRGRKRSRAYSEPSLAYRPAPFAVGRNEFVLRQRGKEHNRSWDPGELAAALIPSPVPRITDVPRLNGKAGNCSSTGDNGGNVFSGKQCLPSAGGTFVGFLRQESVEAYQIAMAANGVGKQRRTTLEEEEEEEWEPVSSRKVRRRPTEKCQDRQLHNSIMQSPPKRQLSRILGARSVDSVQLRPLSDSANCQNWRENSHPGPMNIMSKYSSPKAPNQISISDCKIGWKNSSSTGKWSVVANAQQQQYVPKMPNRIVQPLLSLNSASFSTLNSTAFQQPPRGTCCGATCGGRGRRGGVEMGRRSGVGRGRTWAYEWSRPLTTAANVTSHHHQQLQQQRFVGVNGLNAQQEEGREQRTDLRTTKRVNQLSESAGSGRETEGETRSTRTKTTEKRVHLNPQNGPGYSQNRHFRRHSREQVEKDEKNQRSAPKGESAKASEEGQIESQQQHISGYNFEEREFPALLSGASASSDVGRGDHSQQTEEVADEATNFSVLPPAVAQRTPFALDCGAVGTTSTQSPPGGVQLQFSAVVAGHGRRRATIGTTAESGRRAAGRGGARADQDGREGGSDEAQQQRSGTIGAAERSYAQMLKGPK